MLPNGLKEREFFGLEMRIIILVFFLFFVFFQNLAMIRKFKRSITHVFLSHWFLFSR